MDNQLEIGYGISIGWDELDFGYSRSGGPGGQHVNKVSTRVEVCFDVTGSSKLDDEQKVRILGRLGGRANKAGVLRVFCSKYRSQAANKYAAVEILGELLREALKKERVRKRIRKPCWADRKRLEAKRKRSMLKQQRGANWRIEDD